MNLPSQDLRRRAGSLILRGFRGLEVGDAVAIDLRHRSLAGVVLFDTDGPSGSSERNVDGPGQLAELTAALAAASPGGLPPLIAVDQEGGSVRRLKEKHGFPPSPSARDLGSADPAATERAALGIAESLAKVGINMNLAPVVDVDVFPENPIIGAVGRSYSGDPDTVAAHAAAFVDAHRRHDVLTCLKHFPGHGSSRQDTHLGFTDVTESWSAQELAPYRQLLDSGHVDAVMTAHVFHGGLDDTFPATMSASTIDGLLRQELGFEGVVLSDDMGMAAISRQYGFEEAVARSLGAGVDLLTLANQTEYDDHITERCADVIFRLVESGRLEDTRIDAAAERVHRLRERLVPTEEAT